MQLSIPLFDFDHKQAIAERRLLGLWRMMTGFRLTYIGAIVSLGISAAARAGIPFLLGYLVDTILVAPNASEKLPVFALGFVLLALVQGGFSFMSGRLAAKTAEGVTLRLRNYLFDHLQRLTFAYHDKTPTGDLIQRVTSDVDAIRRFFSEQAVGLGRIVLLFLINFVALLFVNSTLALLSVLVVPLVAAISVFFFRKISARYEKLQEQEAIVSTILQENLSGVRVVKAFARQAYEEDKFQKASWQQYLFGRNLVIMHSLYWPITDIITGIQLLFGYFVGATLVINGTLTVGEYITYAGIIVWIIFPMRELGRLIVQMSTGLVSYDRIKEMLIQDREPLGEDQPAPVKQLRGEVVFDNVGFAYNADTPVIHNISFRAAPGDVIALIGATGSGKTSLVNLLPRFYDYTSGSITIDGHELREYPRSFLRKNIGIVEQEPFLFSRTIRENITYGVSREVSDEEVIAAAKAAALHDVVMTFPDGYATLIGERGVTLSGGQKQRVAIARTLLKDPRILILDDATSSVDTETESSIREALRNLMQGRTSFIIAHRIQTVMDADKILVLNKGRVVQMGTHEELLQQPGIYRQIYDVQSRIESEVEEEVNLV